MFLDLLKNFIRSRTGFTHILRTKDMAHVEKASSERERSEGFLVVGLGNPGEEYRDTRHNVGYKVIDRLGEILNIPLGEISFKAKWGKGRFASEEVILAQPTVFVNLSGESIRALMGGLKTPLSKLIVVHDDLDLPLGTVRIKRNGGSGGHKGIDSIISHLATEEFGRIRVGIGRPPGRQRARDYVLRPFTRRQLEEIDLAIVRAAEAVMAIVQEGFERAMNEYNRK